MNYVEFISKQTDISVTDAIELITPLYLRAIQWNPDSDLTKIKNEKMQTVEDTIVRFVSSKKIKGDLIYFNLEDDCGNPIVDDEGYLSQKLSRTRSTVDCKQLLSLFHHNFVRLNYIVPDEIEELLNIKPSEAKPKNDLNSNDSIAADLDEEFPQVIKEMSEPILRKKVAELTNEKDKWDKSILAALNVGLQISAKELAADITEKAFAAEFEKEFKGLPKTTVSKIHKALPIDYRNIGGSPAKECGGIDDDTLDTIIEASLATGLICSEEEISNAKELEAKLAGIGIDAPPDKYLKAISGASKRVIKKYNESLV